MESKPISSIAEASASGQGAVRVRAASRGDLPEVHRMIQELAAYEGVKCEVTVEDLLEDGFGTSSPWFSLLVAEAGAALVGYALFHRGYSGCTRRSLYLEEVYVRPGHRRGVGEMLFREVCRQGVAESARRVEGQVRASNASALAFYRRLGARDLLEAEGRTGMFMDRACVERLAAAPARKPLNKL